MYAVGIAGWKAGAAGHAPLTVVLTVAACCGAEANTVVVEVVTAAGALTADDVAATVLESLGLDPTIKHQNLFCHLV